MELEEEAFDIHETVSSIGDILHAKVKAKNLMLRISVDMAVARWVRGDGSKIQQIRIDLPSNAVTVTHKGYVTVNVTSDRIFDAFSLGLNICKMHH